MPLIIDDPEIERLARELAAATGRTVEQAVKQALRLHLLRVRAGDGGKAERLMEISRRCAALPDLDNRPTDEILGYDEIGLPR